jgi:hypothetical protein
MAKARFEKGNKIGPRFSKTNQPKNPGRKPSRINQLIRTLKVEDEEEKLSKEDAAKLLGYILGCTKTQIEAMLRNPDVPFAITCQIRGMITDAQNGSTKTINEIMDRIWGKSLQPIEMTGPAGIPLIPDTPMSRKEYEELLNKMTCGA